MPVRENLGALYLRLGQAYYLLHNETRDDVWAGRLPSLRLLRHAQALPLARGGTKNGKTCF